MNTAFSNTAVRNTVFDVVGIGECSVDTVIRLPQPARFGPGAKLAVPPATRQAGGQVATTLCTCSSLGLRTAYVGAWGHDAEGDLLRAELARRGVDASAVRPRPVPTRTATILVEPGGERLVLASRDDALRLAVADVPDELLTRARVVHVDATDLQASLYAARIARRAGVLVTCDVDGGEPTAWALVDAVSLPILAEDVPSLLTGHADPDAALLGLGARHPGPICVTRGRRGAAMFTNGHVYHHPAWQVDAVDTTGAGDIFRGAFIAALLAGESPESILRFATAAAAVGCTRLGAVAGVPTREEVTELSASGRLHIGG